MVIKLQTYLKVLQEEIQKEIQEKNNIEFRISSLELNITRESEQDDCTTKYLKNQLNNQFQESRYVYETYDNDSFETISFKITY
jgi:hypothetical protein